jgi:hypothetical protein
MEAAKTRVAADVNLGLCATTPSGLTRRIVGGVAYPG